MADSTQNKELSRNELRELLKEQTLQAEENSFLQTSPSDPYRLQIHLMPPIGWMNDPNGLCQFKGKYHVFFQYSPLDVDGGMKAWGHYTSSDLVYWNYEGAPFMPDEKYDKDGVYSGSAYVEEEQMYLFYTGNVKQPGAHDYIFSGREANTVMVTSKDGIHFSEKKLLMSNTSYPEDYTCHVRDPKVWKTGDTYYMIQGGRKLGNQGAVLLFASKDLVHWEFHNEVSTIDSFGYMWECPDYFQLQPASWSTYKEPIEILSLSPQGLKSETFRYQNVYQSGYFQILGDITEDGQVTDFNEWDHGFDFYAPQTFVDEKGRRLLIGWAGIPDATYNNDPTVKMGWQHALTVPRELRWRSGKIYQRPVEELKELRSEQVCIEKEQKIELKQGVAYDLEVADIDGGDFLVQLDQEDSGLALAYIGGIFQIEFYGEGASQIGRGRVRRQLFVHSLESVRVLIDTSMVEIYINEGEYALTTRYYIPEGRELCVKCEGSKETLWEMQGYSYTCEDNF